FSRVAPPAFLQQPSARKTHATPRGSFSRHVGDDHGHGPDWVLQEMPDPAPRQERIGMLLADGDQKAERGNVPAAQKPQPLPFGIRLLDGRPFSARPTEPPGETTSRRQRGSSKRCTTGAW